MFLRSLTLRGFKSFADKTTLRFAPGIAVIVGPNGSGKSNVADAIAWVLGEQGPRALRGGQMTDVIFAGSPTRPALGLAEVKLAIDNEAQVIPAPFAEIEVSRTIYRSGESEYRLGGRPCRLLDIQEMLSDTGIGRALHTVVGQGQLDEVLSARPEDRRQFVEEAAGIAKHRRRRERAERKLAGLDDDLLRLHDVMVELRRRLKPLKQQAELAARHEALTAEAKELSRQVAAARLRDLYRARERSRPSWERAELERQRARERLDQLGAEIKQLEAERAEGEAAERRAEAALGDAMRAKSEAEARLRSVMRSEAEAKDRLSRSTLQPGRLFALEEELLRTQHALAEVEATLLDREEQLQRAEAEFRSKERARQDAERERRRLEEEERARRAQLESLRRTLDAHEAESERLAAMMSDLEARAARASARVEALEAEIERLDALETPLAREQTELAAALKELFGAIGDLEAAEKGLLARQEVLHARAEELSESPGSIFVRKRATRALGVLRDLIDAPDDLRSPLAGALGAFADAVVYADGDQAIAEAPRGEGVILAWEPEDSPHPSLPHERSILGSVRPDARVSKLAATLLCDAYVADDLQQARSKAKLHPSARFVTSEGIVVGASFVGTAPRRDAALEGVRRHAGALENELASVRLRTREQKRRHAELSGRAEEVRRRLADADRAITSAAEGLAAAKGEVSAIDRERQVVAERVAAVKAAAGEARERMRALAVAPPPVPALAAHADPPVHLRVEVEALRRERARLAAGVARGSREIQSLASEDPERLRDAAASATRERLALEDVLERAAETLSHASRAHRAAATRARDIRERDAAANREWRDQAAELERVRRAHEEGDRDRLELERRIGEGERLLREGHGSDPAPLVRSLPEEESVQSLQRRADLVARRLGLLGKVNLLATEELDALEERHDFISRELDDVKAARRDLRQVIDDVDRKMTELFEAAFRDVSREFAELFRTLFPGGEGTLVLTDPTDPLRSGIEVEARPGGKRVKRLSLLSGGERSLAALAFLFAIFRARPSPFYVMDEVEAALDDLNLHRFLQVVRGLADRSQVLLVTHQKRTMEMADVLYGVSMGKDGCSTVVSQRLVSVAAT